MNPLTLFIAAWILCGGIAWLVATRRSGSKPLWAVIGQVLGPVAIPLALLVKPKA